MVTPGETAADPPSDAVVLFGGTDLSAFKGGEKWEVKHGVATAKKGGLSSKQSLRRRARSTWSSAPPPR